MLERIFQKESYYLTRAQVSADTHVVRTATNVIKHRKIKIVADDGDVDILC